jgi:hypothetical protein
MLLKAGYGRCFVVSALPEYGRYGATRRLIRRLVRKLA